MTSPHDATGGLPVSRGAATSTLEPPRWCVAALAPTMPTCYRSSWMSPCLPPWALMVPSGMAIAGSHVAASPVMNMTASSAASQAAERASNSTKAPDAVLALILQVVLGVSLATSAVRPTVLSVFDRGAETIGVLFVLIVTAAVARPLRQAFGRQDLASVEFILVVLTPLITRIDLGLLIWVNVNRALVWAEHVLFTAAEEAAAAELLLMASRVWHNGEDRVRDLEFGSVGGEAAVLMASLEKAYNPRNAGGNAMAWIGHVTLWPCALLFHALLQVVTAVGFVAFWFTAWFAHLTSSAWVQSSHTRLRPRAPFWSLLLRRPSGQAAKMYMRHEVAALFDSHQHILESSKRAVRLRWSRLGKVDAIVQHPHFNKLFDVAFPMRAPYVLQQAQQDPVCRDVLRLINKEALLFKDRPDAPLSGIGEPASRQVILYAVMAWPPHTTYAMTTLDRIRAFVDLNTKAWAATEKRMAGNGPALAEFLTVRDILRRFLVQLIMLAWWDGLGRAVQSGVPDVVADLSDIFMTTKLPGVEMASRLLATSPVWYDPLSDGNTMGGALAGPLTVCACTICRDVAATRRLPPARYHSSPRITEVAAELAAAGCASGQSIADRWAAAVRRWVSDIF